MKHPLLALELFCGIGGFAAAIADASVRVLGAFDQSPAALEVYRLNFPEHKACQVDLEKITAEELATYAVDLWWLSPPCQPYSIRGRRRDLDDPRARSLIRLMDLLPQLPPERQPRHIALENVQGFAHSQARQQLLALLQELGYRLRERQLCPTELGIPSRRPRYYLVATRDGFVATVSPPRQFRLLADYIDPVLSNEPPEALKVSDVQVTRFGDGFRLLDPVDPAAYTTCFTAGYGKSLMHAGAYLTCSGGVRRFAPTEIARLLNFPEEFRFPEGMSVRKQWQLLGNSLSVAAVREVLSCLPGLAAISE